MIPTSRVNTGDTKTRWKQVIYCCRSTEGILLIRYFLIRLRWFGIYLHHFQHSDDDRCFHDHPWSFLTFLIGGGYTEHTPQGVFYRRRFSLLYRPAEHRHYVAIDRPVWTLIFRGPIRREWGFHVPELGRTRWISWRDYGKRFCD